MDAISGTQRLTFGVLELADGIGLIPAIMGLFGVAEVISNVEEEMKREIITGNIRLNGHRERELYGALDGDCAGEDRRLRLELALRSSR
jgi:TctA family transporter